LQEAEDGITPSTWLSNQSLILRRDAMAQSLLANSAPEQRSPMPASMMMAKARQEHKYSAKV
jgi:hypothetical protein